MANATVVHSDEGEALWMLNTLMTVKATGASTGGAYSLLEQVVTPAGNPPVHVHNDHDEAFYVLAGEIDVWVGDEHARCVTGTFALAPRGVPHTYAVRTDEARLLVIGAPAGLDEFFVEVGEQAGDRALPSPAEPDVARVAAIGARHGIEILGPPRA
jgi:quercetin dioxygenase-like cupin family protein